MTVFASVPDCFIENLNAQLIQKQKVTQKNQKALPRTDLMPTKPFSRFRVLNESEIHACTAIIAVVLVRRHDISLADLSRDQFFAQHYHILHNLEPQRVIVDRPTRKVILLVLLVAAVFLNGMPAEPRIIAQRLRTRQEALKVLL